MHLALQSYRREKRCWRTRNQRGHISYPINKHLSQPYRYYAQQEVKAKDAKC
jgi:hypothetical protein